MLCELTIEELAAFASGELDAERSAEIGVHVERCAECRERLDDIGQVDAALNSLRRYEPTAEALLDARHSIWRLCSSRRRRRLGSWVA